MKRLLLAWSLACAASLVAFSPAAAERSMSVKELLDRHVGPIRLEQTDMRGVLERVATELHAPVNVDERELESQGVTRSASANFDVPSQPVRTLLAAVVRFVDRGDRCCFTATTDKLGRFELLLTTYAAAKRRGLLVVPLSRGFDPNSVRVSLDIRKNTLENGLLMVCMQVGTRLRLDADGLAAAGVPLTRQFGLTLTGRTIASALDEMLGRFDPSGSTAYRFAEDAAGNSVLVVGPKARMERFGPRPDLENFQDLAEKSPPSPHQAWMLDSPLRPVAEALARPIRAEARQMPLTEALRAVSDAMKFPIKIAAIDLQIAGISRDQAILFDPRGREARAVIYDLLRQSDPEKQSTLVACIELGTDDAAALLVTTRTAANSAGRSLLSDYNLSPDDIPSGRE